MLNMDWLGFLTDSAADDGVLIAAAGCVLAWFGRSLAQTYRPHGSALGDAVASSILTAVALHALLH
ncbi:hypothetical protein [Thiomonas bhubaneswarensis]|uniref:Uncharacterized protein n=1 Tax=Thiomonas bhubaneswarensis TaxID=339866 RepID=A0A0K6HSY5_9BURK|nr:hypothetical protein [Thiomonas bhubaneswarensis]CUA94009.1 hypothetical protein Ga0061069_101489 [Thiomonas bhubaneswarensis]